MIPSELQQQPIWCMWRRETRDGKPTKIPYSPHSTKRAESNNPSTFGDYELALERYRTEDFDGMGILLSNGYSAIDIDHCCVDGVISDFALSVIDTMRCYTEYSPSKTGLRIIFKTPDNFKYDSNTYYIKNPNNGMEIYVCGMTNRFVTMTGNTAYNYPLREVSDELQIVLDTYMVRPVKKSSANTNTNTAPTTPNLSDDELLTKALRNERFRALFEGDMSAYNNDHSSADLALCNMLAFWTRCDYAQIDRLFRRSQLFRPDKWAAREDYSRTTIAKAIASCNTVYDPQAQHTIWDKLGVPAMQTGEWTVSNNGVTLYVPPSKKNAEPAERHITHTPLFPAAYLENLSEGVYKIKINFIHNGVQKHIICDKETISNKSKIVSLSNSGIGVTTENASALVRFFSDMEQINGNIIPHYKSVSHLGWVNNEFLPYGSNVKFDGETSNKSLYAAISQAGDYAAWCNYTHKLRANKYVRLMMAAAFASPLIERVNTLPFVFHLWGSTGKGKTVALMIAMSIWGNPASGQLTRTMNMTNAAMMDSVAFLRNLPFAGDELQTIKTNDMKYDKLIMQITEGIERSRMYYNKQLPSRSWHCSFLFTGEERCTNDYSGGGTKNRVIEVEADGAIVDDGNAVCNFITSNYGYAGKYFIDYVRNRDITSTYREIYASVIKQCETTPKQAMAAAMLLLGDKISTECIYTNETPLTVDDIEPYLKADSEVDVAVRAYDYLLDWIAVNNSKFVGGNYERWGIIEGKDVYIISSVLKQALQDKGFSFDAVKKAWARDGMLVMYQNKFVQRKSIDGQLPYCIHIRWVDTMTNTL